MRITLIDGHPDPAPERLCHTLCDAYEDGARSAGHEVRMIRVAGADIPLLRSRAEFTEAPTPAAAAAAQQSIGWCEHLVLIYPLWLGTMPAALKALLEQTFRPDFAMDYSGGGFPRGKLGGRSARVVVTMGMPALVYRWWFGALSLRSLERHILKFCGIRPVRETLYGMVDRANERERQKWLAEMRNLGARAR